MFYRWNHRTWSSSRRPRKSTPFCCPLNGDFSHIVNYPPKDYKGIVALQMHNHAETLPKLVARLTAYLKAHTMMDHYRGKLLVVELIVSAFGNKGPGRISTVLGQASSRKPRSAIWVKLGCNNSSRGFLRAPRVAIGAVKL